MSSLPKHLRNELEKAVRQARPFAEAGAREALAALAVDQKEPFGHMSAEQKLLRNRLRAHGRGLGDHRDKLNGKQSLDHLAHAVAYEHWHRMLFARFLAENNCLLEPEHKVALSLADVEELAREEKADPWELAGRYAQEMLPQIFRSDDPVLILSLARETRVKLEKILASLAPEVFRADDSLGWVYQFWQADAKDAANKAGRKVDADTLPAVTQLFTEDYMVEFILHNSLACYVGKGEGRGMKDEGEEKRFSSEQEARDYLSLPSRDGLPGVDWRYLRIPPDPDNPSSFILHPSSFRSDRGVLAQLKLLDPSMGSGHFLVFALPMLARLRMEAEGLSAAEAIRAVLRENLHGLEIDERCGQLAAFNLALAAWRLCPDLLNDGEGLPPLNLAICGLAPVGTREEWLGILEGRGKPDLRFFMGALYDNFQKAPVLGSLLNPQRLLGGLFDQERLPELLEATEVAIRESHPNQGDRYETGVVAHGLAKAISLLAGRYDLIVTNVPYLARGRQGEALVEFIHKFYPTGKADLATAFLLRIREFLSPDGLTGLVLPHYWLFLQTYKGLRKNILADSTICSLCRLGPGAFETISGEVVNVSLLLLKGNPPGSGHTFHGIDVSKRRTISEKEGALRNDSLVHVRQANQLMTPDCRITFSDYTQTVLMSEFAEGLHGQGCFDAPCFVFKSWEVAERASVWELQQTTSEKSGPYQGRTGLFRWEKGSGLLAELMDLKRQGGYTSGKWRAGTNIWGQTGIAASGMGSIYFSLYNGSAFDENVSVVFPSNPDLVRAIWCYCESGDFEREIRKVDQKFKVTCNTLVKVPFDSNHWTQVGKERYPNGLPEPYSNDPTQWLFKGRVDDATEPLQVAVARLLGYRWPAETDPKKAGVTVFDSDRAHWKALAPLVDEDGIVSLNPLRNQSACDSRLRALLHRAFDAAREHRYQLPANWRDDEVPAAPRPLDFKSADAWIDHLLDRAGAADLDAYLRNTFFEEHCKIFSHRPFIWHTWDGRPDGFHALVNYHKLAAPNGGGRKLLESLTFSYLGEWIRRQADDAKRGEPGAEDRLLAAQQLQEELQKILAGEPPYDIFVRWKPLHEQAIGWDSDINDGVRLNIRPFMKAKDVRRGGAGLLRYKPNIKWGKDRGKEPIRLREDFPWFWGWDEKTTDFRGTEKFDGNRWNDCHYTNDAKRQARSRKANGATI